MWKNFRSPQSLSGEALAQHLVPIPCPALAAPLSGESECRSRDSGSSGQSREVTGATGRISGVRLAPRRVGEAVRGSEGKRLILGSSAAAEPRRLPDPRAPVAVSHVLLGLSPGSLLRRLARGSAQLPAAGCPGPTEPSAPGPGSGKSLCP